MKRTGSMRSRVGPAVMSTRLPASAHALGELERLEHAALADLPARLIALGGPEDLHAALRERADVGARGGIGPHDVVHGRRHRDRRLGRETQRREQIVRLPGGEAGEKIRARGRDEHGVRPARELDVAHGSLCGRIPQVAAHRAPRDRLEGGRCYELARARGHHDLHFRAALAQAPHEVRALVGGDAARHAKKNAFALHGNSFRLGQLSHRASRCAQTSGRICGQLCHFGRFLPLPPRGCGSLDCLPTVVRTEGNEHPALARR